MDNYENSTFIDGFTLEMVLEDKMPSPLGLKDFISYLDQTYCTENLAFYQAVTEYWTTSQFFFGRTTLTTRQNEKDQQIGHQEESQVKSVLSSSSSPASVRLMNGQLFTFQKNQYHLLAPEEQTCFDYMMMQFNTIVDQFIQVNANQEINIPADMKQQLLINAQQHYCYHPSLLAPAYTSILELLRISAFIPFITDPQRLALFSGATTSNDIAVSLSSSTSSNITFASTSSSTCTTSSLSSSTSLASTPSPAGQRPSYFYRSSSHPIQPPSPSPPQNPPTLPWALRRLKSSPSLNAKFTSSSLVPPLPSFPALRPSMSTSITCRSSTDGGPVHRLPVQSRRPCSIYSQADSMTDPDDLKSPLKKWTDSFRRSPSPQNRLGGWRQITVHDSPLFKQSYHVHHRPS